MWQTFLKMPLPMVPMWIVFVFYLTMIFLLAFYWNSSWSRVARPLLRGVVFGSVFWFVWDLIIDINTARFSSLMFGYEIGTTWLYLWSMAEVGLVVNESRGTDFFRRLMPYMYGLGGLELVLTALLSWHVQIGPIGNGAFLNTTGPWGSMLNLASNFIPFGVLAYSMIWGRSSSVWMYRLAFVLSVPGLLNDAFLAQKGWPFPLSWTAGLAFLIVFGVQMTLQIRETTHRLLWDGLTKATSRAQGEILLKGWLDRQHVGLMYLDCDYFKTINDQAGHAAGDLVLQELVQRVNSVLKRQDFIMRLGGDEFCVVLPSVRHAQQLEDYRHWVERAFANPGWMVVTPGGDGIPVHVSIGTFLCDPHMTVDQALGRTDDAMYTQKEQHHQQHQQLSRRGH